MVLLVLTLPLFIVTALAIRLDSPGPVFRPVPHVGTGGRTFRLLMFRSTTSNIPPARAAELTGVGRLIYPTRVDQLPILLNLLRGDITLIGPCPEPLSMATRNASATRALGLPPTKKPGLTGWCAVN
jgi:lipopolysaccharide/colanic/teichoic acid biosynthesis glycosyltransferase